MLHILHGADFHLDAPFASLTHDKALMRRAEQRELLTRLADTARTRGADLVLLSGDLLDGAAAYAETEQALARALGQTGCPVFIAPGNHDFWSQKGPYAAPGWPENVHIFSANELTGVPLPALGCTVYGGAFTGQFRDESPLEGFAAPRDGLLHIGVLHGDVEGGGRYGSIPREDIAASGLDYLALGHIHTASGLQKTGETHWAYPGCPEGRGFDETGEKGALFLSVEPGHVTAEFIPLARRRYEILEVDVSAAETPEAALVAALPHHGQDDIYRILLTGESGLAGLDLAPLAALVAPCFYSVTLHDRTKIRRDLWSRAGEDTLTGLFLRRMKDKLAATDDTEETAILEQAVRFGLAALEHGEDCRP